MSVSFFINKDSDSFLNSMEARLNVRKDNVIMV